MSHQVHPKIFRVRETKDWTSRWYAKKDYAELLREDFIIRNFLEEKLKESGLEIIEIERFPGKLNIIINSSRPGLIIGRGGSGIEQLRKELAKIILKERATVKTQLNQQGLNKSVPATDKNAAEKEIRLEIREIKNPWVSAALSGQWIAQQLQRRIPHRRVLKQAIGKIMANKEIQGVKIEVAGRLGGAEIARREWLKEGRLPLQTIRSIIDYALVEAQTTYGTVGIKVWMFKGETFDE